MGAAFYPVFEGQSNDWPDDINGKCLAKIANRKCDKACKKAGVPTLYDFFSMAKDDMIADLLGGDPDDPNSFDDSKLPPEHWFCPSEGLRTIRVVTEYVQANSHRIDQAEFLLEDLQAFERHLTLAKERGVRWHLCIVA